MKNKVLILSVVASGLMTISGCASVAVSNDAIKTNTARALGSDPSKLTILDRSDSGIKTVYMAKTDNGREYSCYVTGTISVVGKIVSDAICTPLGTGTTSDSEEATVECNALLAEAGKC